MPRPRPANHASRLARAAGAVALLVWSAISGGCDRASPEGEPLAVRNHFGELGTAPGQFSYPRAMDLADGSLWVVDKSARVQRIDAETGRPSADWTMPRFDRGKPCGITIAPGRGLRVDGTELRDDSLVYIADTHEHRVMIYRPPATLDDEPELVASFGSYGEADAQFIYTTDVAVLMTEDGTRVHRLYIAEYGGNDRVSVYDHELKFMFAFGAFGVVGEEERGEVLFSRPQSIEIDHGRRELVIADACNHRIGRFTLDGQLIAWIGDEPGRGDGAFLYPYGLELLGDGTALVCEFGNARVQRVELATGAGLGHWGVPGRGEGELATPWAVATHAGLVYVLDSGNNRVLAFRGPVWDQPHASGSAH